MLVNRRNFRFSSIVLLIMGLIWIFWSRTESTDQEITSAAQKGFLAPDFEAVTLSGETITLSALRGQPVILNHWASWCPPCREEMPALQQIYTDFSEQGLIVLGVNTTAQDSREAAGSFVAEYGLTFPIPLDSNGDISRLYRLQALPTTYFIDSDGVIRDIIIGGPVAEAVLRSQTVSLLQGDP
jgi:cytochrome c biogenesis protein CcmG/thiol:disulfide interchange protein DsbE